MDSMLAEILKNAAAPVVIAGLFLWFMDRVNKQNAENAAQTEAQRQEAAKQLAQERREYDAAIRSMFANTMKEMLSKVTQSNERIVEALSEHEKASQERYERMGNTQEIIDKLDQMKKEQGNP